MYQSSISVETLLLQSKGGKHLQRVCLIPLLGLLTFGSATLTRSRRLQSYWPALKHNACLAKLLLDVDDYTDIMWTTLSRVLWDTSSLLENIYLSNHTLCALDLSIRNQEIGNDIVSNAIAKASQEVKASLLLNDNEDKAGVSRHKILLRQNRDNTVEVTRLITNDVPEATLPVAIAWIGRDEWGYSLMYNTVQNFPELFDSRNIQPAVAKKRKL